MVYEKACRLLNTKMLARARSDSAFMRANKDVSRYFFGYFALYLDARGGLTLSAIRDFCSEIGLASPGRAAAILFRLRMLGYVRLDTDTKDRRVRRYVPTEGLRHAFRHAHRDDLSALALMEPEAEIAAQRLDEPEFFRAFLLRGGQGVAGVVAGDRGSATTTFTARDSGTVILFDIVSSGEPGDVYPPQGPVRMLVTELARRHDVSRSHVLKMLRDAEAKGLLNRNPDERTGLLSQALRDAVVLLHVTQLLGNAACAHAAFEATSTAATSIAAS